MLAIGFVYSWSCWSAFFASLIVGWVLGKYGAPVVFVTFTFSMLLVALSIGMLGPNTKQRSRETLAGNLRIVEKGHLQLAPVPDAPGGNGLGLRGAGGRRLLDIALDPDYKSTGWICLVTCHGVKNAKGKLDGLARIERDASATAAGSTTKSSSNSPST